MLFPVWEKITISNKSFNNENGIKTDFHPKNNQERAFSINISSLKTFLQDILEEEKLPYKEGMRHKEE